jgi:ABC-type nitrate/sulfonate/bicarbonate transport system permease component
MRGPRHGAFWFRLCWRSLLAAASLSSLMAHLRLRASSTGGSNRCSTRFPRSAGRSWRRSGLIQAAILIPFCLINIAEGLRNIDRELMEMGQSFTRRRLRILWRLTFPLLVPYGLSAVRIAYGVAWKIALVAELLGATDGLGYLMLRAQTAADSTTFLATCFAIVLIFVAGERLVIVPLERRFARR